MKKRLLYIVALILTGITHSAFIYGQSTDLDKLQGKTWRWHWDYGYSDYKYSRIAQTIMHDYSNEPSDDISFYLSNTPETTFDYSKVGKVENGRYIIKEGYPGYENDPHFGIFVYEIVKLDNAELILKLSNGSIATLKALDVFTMKYIITGNNTPTGTLPFSGSRNRKFLEDGAVPVNHTIADRIYKNVQLTQSDYLSSQKRGKFLRKFNLGSNFIVVVTFGDQSENRTDVICLVNSLGNVLSTLEGLVIVDGMMVKNYTILPDKVHIYQVVPDSSTSLSFDDVSFFDGKVVPYLYDISGSSFVKIDAYTQSQLQSTSTKRFTKGLLSNPDKDVQNY